MEQKTKREQVLERSRKADEAAGIRKPKSVETEAQENTEEEEEVEEEELEEAQDEEQK